MLLEAFLPDAAQKIFAQLNTDKTDFDSLSSFGALPEGHQVGQAEILFARMDAEKKLEEVAAVQAAHAPQEEQKVPLPPHAPKDPIVSDEFAKVELTVAKVLHCEKGEEEQEAAAL